MEIDSLSFSVKKDAPKRFFGKDSLIKLQRGDTTPGSKRDPVNSID
jgi:hypothetical protein